MHVYRHVYRHRTRFIHYTGNIIQGTLKNLYLILGRNTHGRINTYMHMPIHMHCTHALCTCIVHMPIHMHCTHAYTHALYTCLYTCIIHMPIHMHYTHAYTHALYKCLYTCIIHMPIHMHYTEYFEDFQEFVPHPWTPPPRSSPPYQTFLHY
jgi:hypothetical protein